MKWKSAAGILLAISLILIRHHLTHPRPAAKGAPTASSTGHPDSSPALETPSASTRPYKSRLRPSPLSLTDTLRLLNSTPLAPLDLPGQTLRQRITALNQIAGDAGIHRDRLTVSFQDPNPAVSPEIFLSSKVPANHFPGGSLADLIQENLGTYLFRHQVTPGRVEFITQTCSAAIKIAPLSADPSQPFEVIPSE